MRKKCNLWMFLAIASSIGMHFYRTLQTINNISIPTNSQQNDNMLVEQMVLQATTTIDIEQPTHAQVCDPQNSTMNGFSLESYFISLSFQ